VLILTKVVHKFRRLRIKKKGVLLTIFLILSFGQGCKYQRSLNLVEPEQQNLPTETSVSKTKAVSENLAPSKPYEVHQNSNTLSALLVKGNFLERMNRWKGKALFVKFDSTKVPNAFRYYYFNSLYQDTNQNKIQDIADQGFFNPGSTVKVGLVALVLEELNRIGLGRETEYRVANSGNWYRISEDIRRAIAISDNDATNRLILWLGFDKINTSFRKKGLSHLVIDRLMLDRGTLIKSPPFEMRFKNKIVRQNTQSVSVKPTCYETTQKVGNCATATDLVNGLIRINQPEYFRDKGFDIRPGDRNWLKQIMSHTPQQEGFNYPDDYCRFLTGLENKIANRVGKLLSKCGVSLFSNTYTDLSFIETNSGEKYYVVLSVNPPQGSSEKEIIQWMNTVAEFILPQLP